jgi:hypothetical protein
MDFASLSFRSKRIPLAFFFAVVAIAVGPGCFHGADISKIACNETKYCPSGYVCVVPAGKTQGSCQKPGDGGGAEAIASLDGPAGIDGARGLDSASLDLGGGGVDQALGNVDSADAPVDTNIGVDLSVADVRAESPKPVIDSSDSSDSSDSPAIDAPPDLPMVADAPADRPGIDAPLKAGGATCQTGVECASTYCADGYCCNTACTGTCQACDVGTSVGTCTTLAANAPPRPGHTACVATDATCGGRCDGTSAACAYPSNTPCGTASCVGNSYQAAGTCSNGACNTQNSQACSNACVATAGGCVACTPGSYQCSGTQPQKCDSTGTWQNYGSRACTGSCETCTSSATTATCTNVTTPPSGKSCNGTDATCKGYCSGSSEACTYPDNSIACSSSTCSSGSLTTQYCNSAGSCSTVKNQSCNGFPCASGSSCAVACTALSTTGCLDGYECGTGGNTCTRATVPCGQDGSTLCSIANQGGCVYTETGLICGSPNPTGLAIPCDSKAECPSGSYCCMSGNGSCAPPIATGGAWSAYCTTNTSNCVDAPPYSYGYYLCDPSFGSADCPSGKICKKIDSTVVCYPGIYSCQ